MSDKHIPVTHDPAAVVDLSIPTEAAAQRIRYRTTGAVKYLRTALEREGMVGTDQLADALYRESMAMQELGPRGEHFPQKGVDPGDEDLWRCTFCENVNPPTASLCLACSNEPVDEPVEPVAEEVGAPPVTPPGIGATTSESV